MEKVNRDIEIAKKYISLHSSASSREKDFNLELSDVKKLLSAKRCFFTGELFCQENDRENSRSIDRLNNEKGYIKGNVVACTIRINRLKGVLSIEDIRNLFKGLVKKGIYEK